jgi:hypothetical protein
MSRRLQARVASVTLICLFLLTHAPGVGATLTDEHIQRLKLLQRQMLLREPAEKLEKLERRRKSRKRTARAGSRLRRPPASGSGEFGRPSGVIAPRRTRPSSLAGGAATPTIVNDPTGELVGTCQSEVSIASYGNFVVAAWNDGIGIYDDPATDTQGFGYSIDGGATWVDGGIPPTANVGTWNSDPVVVVNEKTGAFYFAALCNVSDSENGIGVVKGTFCGGTFSWGTPTLAISVDNSVATLDKNWMAVDSLTGNLYVSYSYFDVVGSQVVSDQIQIVRSTDDGQTWSSPRTLSDPGDAGFVQGSRPAVGPAGEVYVVWHAVGQTSGCDFLRVRKSIDGGATFGSEVTADCVYSNFGSGAPGFDRGLGITFPGIAVDRSGGPHRGRVYLTWNESVDFYTDPLPDPQSPAPGVARREVEPNNGSLLATPFTPGDVLRGLISTTGNPGDHDYWKFDGTQGQTVVFYLDSLGTSLDAAFRIFCSDGYTRLGFSQNGNGGDELLVLTLPSTGTYYIRVASYEGKQIGGYRILTGLHVPQSDRARDHRDVFVKASDDGLTWGPTVRVNDSPGLFDDWLPEVTVDGNGRVYEAHYDFRDAVGLCGGASHVYLGHSDDGGATWSPEIRVSDVATNWSTTYSTLIPDQGDYIGLSARGSEVLVGWADGRLGDPDVFVAPAPLTTCTEAPVSAVSALATTQDITLTWSAPDGFTATLFRQVAGVETDLGQLTADPSNQIVYQDTDVVPGVTYSYRLGVQGFCVPSTCGLSAQLPCNAAPVALVGAQASLDSVTVSWSAPAGFGATLFRRDGAAPYQDLGPVTADAANTIVYVDRSVTPGRSYGYRLGVQGFCQAFVGAVTVSVPALELALYGFQPNPTAQDVNVSFSLASGDPAALALYDVSGREVYRLQVGALGPGPHVVNLTQGVSVKAGLYFVRLSQGGRTRVRRVAIFP